MVALHLEFVAKPNGSHDLTGEVTSAIEDAQLENEGLEASLLLVCDREARLVTLLTFWDRSRFLADRESRIAWMQKLLAPFADGTVRAHTSRPRFVAQEGDELPAVEALDLGDAQFGEAAAG